MNSKARRASTLRLAVVLRVLLPVSLTEAQGPPAAAHAPDMVTPENW